MNGRGLKSIAGWLLVGGLTILLFAGCTPSRVEWDKAALLEGKKVPVVLYPVPISIQYRDDPKEKKKSGLQMLAAVANANNGTRAATLAQKTFIEQLNKSDLRFKVIPQAEMMGNSAFVALANKELAAKAERVAKAAAGKPKEGGAS